AGWRKAGATQRSCYAGLRMELERRNGRVDVVDVARLDARDAAVFQRIVAVGDVEVVAAFRAAVDSTRCRPELGAPTSAARNSSRTGGGFRRGRRGVKRQRDRQQIAGAACSGG